MNYLAHLFLAETITTSDLEIIGNLMGDFLKGPLKGEYPFLMEEGVWLHRRIDSFTDRHPAFKASRLLFRAPQRRYAGVVIDICFDHFLSSRWAKYSAEARAPFIDRQYRRLERHQQLLPSRLQRALPYMVKDDWLSSYRSLGGLELTLSKLSTRMKRPYSVPDVMTDIERSYSALSECFEAVFADAQDFVVEEYANRNIQS